MFEENKYTKIYFNIIDNAKLTPRQKQTGNYFEKHHIIPRCLGGDNTKNNLILLTAREHFICHILLTKMIQKHSIHWRKVVYAAVNMIRISPNQHRYFNSRLYDIARKYVGELTSISQSGDKNSQYGKIWVSHKKLDNPIKISKKDMNEYINNGYVVGRISSKKFKLMQDKTEKDLSELDIKIIELKERLITLEIKRIKLMSN